MKNYSFRKMLALRLVSERDLQKKKLSTVSSILAKGIMKEVISTSSKQRIKAEAISMVNFPLLSSRDDN